MKLICYTAILLAMSTVLNAAAPIVIAHRGASGYLPEHTLEAKALAHAMGADFLEQDLVLSKDNVPMVLHDIHIDTVTDVATRFPDRKREDGRYYALDFTATELKQLRVTERITAKTGKAVYPARFPAGKSSFQIPTLEEELEFISGLIKSTGRTVGIYPEIKQPAWHHKQGRDISRVVLPILERHGYRTKADPCWVQCFELDEVKRIRGELGWKGRLVMLMGGAKKGEDGTDFDYLRDPAGLDELAKIVDGIGPALSAIISGKGVADRKVTSLVKAAHARKLVVHPYTVRSDELPKTVTSVEELHHLLFVEAGVDGVFSDFPDKTVNFVRAIR
jgi:glycerophosphoryl diester phosphodiesterase